MRLLTRIALYACFLVSIVAVHGRAAAWRTASDLPEFVGETRVRVGGDEFRFEVSTQSAPLPSSETTASAIAAAETWSDVACSALTVRFDGVTTRAALPGDGRNTVQWIDVGWESRGYPVDAAGATEIEYEREPGGAWGIVEADIFLNGQFHWTGPASAGDSARSLQAVLTHEVGHAIGLLHPCEIDLAPICRSDNVAISQSTMYPTYASDQSSLAEDDVEGLCYLYDAGAAPCACGAHQVCGRDGCRDTCGASTCIVGHMCVDGNCVAPAECNGDEECEDGLLCVDAGCRPAVGLAPAGYPCAADADCATGFCSASAVCDCRVTDCTINRVFGESCAAGVDCTSGLCLVEVAEGYCTEACGSLVCPSGFACAVISGRQVCQLAVSSESCSLTRPHAPGARLPWLAIGIAVVLRVAKKKSRKGG